MLRKNREKVRCCARTGGSCQKGEIMKRKYIYTIVAAALLVCLGMSVVFLRPDKEQQLVKEFLDQTFTKSEENANVVSGSHGFTVRHRGWV